MVDTKVILMGIELTSGTDTILVPAVLSTDSTVIYGSFARFLTSLFLIFPTSFISSMVSSQSKAICEVLFATVTAFGGPCSINKELSY